MDIHWTCSRHGDGIERIYTHIRGEALRDNVTDKEEKLGTFKAIHVDISEALKHLECPSDLMNYKHQGWEELYPYLRYCAPKNFLYLQEVKVDPAFRRSGVMRRIVDDLAGTWANEEIVIYPEPLDVKDPVAKLDLIMWYENVGFIERRFWHTQPSPGYKASVMVKMPS